MKPQQVIVRETLHIAAGCGILCAVMLVIFAVCGQLGLPAVLGAVLGGGWAVLNFFLMGLSVQKAAADPARSKQIVQFSYSMRMLGMVLVLILGFTMPWLHWLAVLLPQLFPRVTIGAMQAMGMYKPAPAPSEGGEE